MLKRTWFKLTHLMVIAVLLFTALPLSALAEEDAAPPADANTMSRSMITFFREDRTNLQVERVARDELMIYGIFMSNFFTPWSTQLKDMVDDKAENGIPKKMSTKFFGSAEKSAQMTELNKKLYDPIKQTLGFDPKTFSLYATKKADKVMTGQDFYNKVAGKDKDNNIYDSTGNTILMDLGSPATQASLQVLFGFSPEYMLSKDKGLRALTGLYMDGLGNIWGSYGKAEPDNYVLFFPSALNPRVFPKGNDGKFKFPVSNVFTMGGVLKLQSNFLDKAPYNTPYYNINSYIPDSKYNKGNVVSIFGVQSATNSLGTSNAIIKEGVSGNPMQSVEAMLSQDSSSTMTEDQANVVLSVDVSKAGDLKPYIKEGNDLSDKQKDTLINYLFKTQVFKLNQLADDMYYFNVPRAQAQNASGGEEGSFSEPTDLIIKQKLFAKEMAEGGYGFYSSSHLPSPFNIFLEKFKADPSKQDALLKSVLPNKDKVDVKSAEFIALKSFLNKGTFGVRDYGQINKALTLMEGTTPLAYNLVTPSNPEKIIKEGWEWFYPSYASTSFALTSNDSSTVAQSLAIRNKNIFKNLNGTSDDIISDSPFLGLDSGGSITTNEKDDKLTDKEVHSVAHYFYNANVYRIFSFNSVFTSKLTGKPSGESFTTPFGDKKFKSKTAIMNDVNNFPGIYWGYMVGLLNISPKADGSGWNDITPYQNPYLPPMEISTLGGGLDLNEAFSGSGVVASEDKTLEEMQKDIINKVYGLLSEGPNNTRDKIIKAAQDSWIISTHRAITGSWTGDIVSVSSGGNGSYASVVGYINTPSLQDLPLTDWILQDYMYIYMLLLLIVLIVLILMVITNMRTFREGILILILMSFVLILPQYLVSNVINISNTAGDKLYSGRFDYWAITQHQQTKKSIDSVRMTGDEMDYVIANSMQAASNVNSSDVGVRVKWMSPKKDDVFDSMFNKKTASEDLMSNLTIFRWLFSSTLNQEEYVHNDPLATYLYRPYNAISTEAKNSYSAMSGTVVKREDVAKKINGVAKNRLGVPDYRFSLLNKPQGSVVYTKPQKDLIEEAGAYITSTDKDKMLSYRYWALNNEAVTKGIFRSNYATDAGINGDLTNPSYVAYSLSTESPFYYFYNVLSHRYAEDGASFKSALLSKEIFKVDSTNTKVNKATRDFLDMEGLFTYVIPYLHQGNEYVYGWTNVYGRDIDGYNFAEGVAPDKSKNLELYNQFLSEETKKENLKKVWKLYTPWVDQMYSQDVLDEMVYVADKKKAVADTLNPGAYQKVGRAMIFSEADMYAKSYRYSDLSDTERRIQATLDTTYEDMMYLTNYYDFDDEVLVTAAAMMATFNFNREFSDNKLVGESSVLYPQGFELKNFNYDAFMRLMLLNSTGEPLMGEKDLYSRILDKTSIFTGILLILCDVLAVIAIPAAKVIVLLLLLFLSIAISISSVLTPPEKIVSTIIKALGLPSLLFLVSSVAFAFIVSLFMGEGLTGYVGGRAPELGISDPTVTMGLMLVVDGLYLYVLWQIIKLLIDGLKRHSISSFFSTVSLVAGAGTSLVNGAMDKAKGALGYGVRRHHRQEMLEAMRGVNNGSGARFGGTGGTDAYNGGSDVVGSIDKPLPTDSSIPTNPSAKDDDFQSFLDNKASHMHGSDNSETASKSLGHKVIDFKYDMKNKAYDAVDTVRNTGSDILDSAKDTGSSFKDSINYATSKEGFRRDAVDSVKEVKTKTTNYAKDLSNYNTQRGDEERLRRMEQKIEARKKRDAIINSRQNPTPSTE